MLLDKKNALDRYQQAAARTANEHEYELANYGLGITGEAGEVADLIKKGVFHGHELDREELKKELGDVMWYVANVARLAGFSLSEIAASNVMKLQKRYPEGFSEQDSINRKN